MRGILSLVVSQIAMFMTAAQSLQNGTNVVDFLGRALQKEVQAVKQPIDESIAFIGSSQCKHVKKLLGVSYEQLQESEPDLNGLTIVYRSKLVTAIINMTYVVEALQARSSEGAQELVLFAHGFTDDPSKDSFGNISEAYLGNGHSRVVALDGSSLIRWLYLRASTYVRFIGERIGHVLAAMVQHGQDPKKIHLVGHSLGAHIAGFIGKTFYNLTGSRIGRITGLDPAGPCFTHVDPDLRLKESDADFVDVIHTDSGVYGIKEAVGHADYYPNGGSQQPSCVFQTCSHSYAWRLYGASVTRPRAFPAVKCNSWEEFKKGRCGNEISYMGLAAEPSARGKFYLQTSGDYPFTLGEEGLKYKNNDGIVKNIQDTLFG
ncbi:putative lipase [Danaus plexippus plexippus]|uniref:Lipase n=1 Tax=Danaus plexippus plexippus TaxID=278856 RepID=A0A212EJL3_DANPL|nr:putative lipase [Danaus plexippus plexippus]